MNLKETKLSRKTVLNPGDYVEAVKGEIKFHPEAFVDTLYGSMSPAEVTQRTTPRRKRQLTPGSWSG